MLDRVARDLAARLTRDFRAGLLTNDELEDGWPQSLNDRALIAIGTTLWRFYDDHHAHVLKRSDWTDAELDRYAAFLDTDLPYEWSEDRFDKFDWSAMIPFASAMPWVGSRRKRIKEARRLEGDPDAWPFIRAADVKVS